MHGDTSPDTPTLDEPAGRINFGSLAWQLGLTLWLLGSASLLLTAYFWLANLSGHVISARQAQGEQFAYALILRFHQQPDESSRKLYAWLLQEAPTLGYRYISLRYANVSVRTAAGVTTQPGEEVVKWGRQLPDDYVLHLKLPHAGRYNVLLLELHFDALPTTVWNMLLWRGGGLLLLWLLWSGMLVGLLRTLWVNPVQNLLTDLRLQRDLSEPLRLAVPLAAQDELSNIRRLCNGIWERLLLQHQRLLDTIARLQYASTHLEQLARQRTQTLERVATNLQRNEGWLHAFAAIASGSAPVMTRIEELLALACRCAEMDIGFVTLNRGKALKVMAVYPAVASVPSEAELPYAATLYDQVHQQQTLVTYLRLSASPWAASAPNSHEGAYLGLPLLLPRQVMVGAFHLYRASERPNALDPDELSLIRLCAAAIGSALLRDWHEQMLYQAKERAQVTLASIGDAVFVTNAHGQVEYLNPAAEQLSDWDSARARHTDIQALLPLVDAAGDSLVTHPVQLCFQSRKVIRIQDCFLPSGTTKAPLLAVEGTVAAIRNRHGVTEGAVVVIADVSAERALLQQLHFQSQHDPLTGLVNRHEFERRLGVVMESPEVGQHVLCYLDLDQFKLVNDTCGHAVGDELLRQVAHLLQKQLELGDTLARLGGDEFGALLLHCTPDESLNRSRRLRDAISNFRFGWQGRVFSVGVSIGLVRLGDVHKNLALALSAADSACYAAKEQGRNRVHTFQPDDLDMARRQGEMQWVLRIKQALEEDRFILYHQPIIALAHDRLPRQRHSEILLRMRDEEGRIIPPGAFLGAAERYDLMPQIDRWVIERVFSQFQAWLKDGSLRLHRCSINLSGASMGEADLGYFIRHRLKAYHLPPELFCFEITETSAISNLQQARKLIDSLKQLGCAFSLDDFGSGLSSFGYLKNLPVDYLKIDGAFIRDMENDPIDYAMVRSINEVGHLMHLKTVAEFVQTQQVLEMLREIHVDYAQGYWLAKPVPLTLMTQI